jgi:Mycothiol maleylpyruvate isomerase N-terminal domain
MLLGVTPEMIVKAFGAESQRLSEVLAAVDDAAFARASGCPPWSVAELAFHVRMTIGRLPGMLDGPSLAPAGAGLVSATEYYRPMGGSLTLPTPTGFGPRSLGRRRCPTLAPVLAISGQRGSRRGGCFR